MPTPEPGEKRAEFIQRCVAYVAKEEPDSSMKERLGKCYGLWRAYEKKGAADAGQDVPNRRA